ncbi:MAG: hypothetical protein RIM99_00215 [Cyclobacteriaceae bacterium]
MLRIFLYLIATITAGISCAQSGLHPQWASEEEITYYDRSGNVWSYNIQTDKRSRVLKGSQPAPNPIRSNLFAVRSNVNGKSSLVIRNVKSDEEIVIDGPKLSNMRAFHPIWSRDGRMLAFNAENAELKMSSLFIYDLERKNLDSYLKDRYVGAPSFFSNGDVLISLLQDDGSTLVRYDYKSNQITELVKSTSRIFFADASPSGDDLVICSGESGNLDLWIINVETGNRKQLTKTPNDEYAPRWSPSGKQILYFANINDAYQVWVIDRDGSNVTNLNN